MPLQVYGLNHTGSGIFIVVFATVTAWVAALRYGMLRKGLRGSQILGVLMIVGGQALVVRDGTAGSEASTLAFVSGVVAILAAAFLDAVMYVFTERAAAQRSPTLLRSKPLQSIAHRPPAPTDARLLHMYPKGVLQNQKRPPGVRGHPFQR